MTFGEMAERITVKHGDASDTLNRSIALALREAHLNGIRAYAWQKDGVTYVGTCGTTLKEAEELVNRTQAPIWE